MIVLQVDDALLLVGDLIAASPRRSSWWEKEARPSRRIRMALD